MVRILLKKYKKTGWDIERWKKKKKKFKKKIFFFLKKKKKKNWIWVFLIKKVIKF